MSRRTRQSAPSSKGKDHADDLYSPALYINRELSSLKFYTRVLDEAEDHRHPLLERIRSIYYSNLNEFFMIRVSGLREQVTAELSELSSDGMTATEQLAAIREQVTLLLRRQQRLLHDDILPALSEHGLRVVDIDDVTDEERAALDAYYEREVFPVLTPLAVDPGHPFPHISNLSLNLAVAIDDPVYGNRFARLKIPNVLPRFVCAESARMGDENTVLPGRTYVPLEQLIAANLADLFPGLRVIEAYPFQVVRDADIEIAEDEDSDLSHSVRQALSARRFGSVVCLFVNEAMPERIRALLMQNLEIEPSDVYPIKGLLALNSLMELYRLDRPDLKDAPVQLHIPAILHASEDIFATIAHHDILLHHPFDSFKPILDFMHAAARDPNVLAIKQTLYRVGGSHAPVVDALLAAASEGKQVAVLVELKARFEEENNIEWARTLERAGAHVTYGLVGLKTHAKTLLVVRKEHDGLRRYVHLGTGNYNVTTARGYTDFGLLSARSELGADVTELFNYLTGYSHQDEYRKLLVAPVNMRRLLMRLIEREIAHGDKGHIVFKMNALVDRDIIAALYRASRAGVRIDLLVRGVCCLRPGVPGVSDTIRVTSLVARFLEHSRVYYFKNDGAEEVYLGSADMMPRNLDRRVETLFPVEDPQLCRRLIHILTIYQQDTANGHLLQPDGAYTRIDAKGKPPFDAQTYFLAHEE